jgi:hypothetical protein
MRNAARVHVRPKARLKRKTSSTVQKHPWTILDTGWRRDTVALCLMRHRSMIAVPCWRDSEGEVVEDGAEPVGSRNLGGGVVVAVAQVLHEGMSRGENPDAAVALQPASAAAVAFQPPVICLDRVVRVLLNGVQGRGSQFVEPPRASCGTGQGSKARGERPRG